MTIYQHRSAQDGAPAAEVLLRHGCAARPMQGKNASGSTAAAGAGHSPGTDTRGRIRSATWPLRLWQVTLLRILAGLLPHQRAGILQGRATVRG